MFALKFDFQLQVGIEGQIKKRSCIELSRSTLGKISYISWPFASKLQSDI